MTKGLELEPFEFFRSPCQGMPLQGPVYASEVSAMAASSGKASFLNRISPEVTWSAGGGGLQ